MCIALSRIAGIGETELAHQVVRELRLRFPDGVLRVDLDESHGTLDFHPPGDAATAAGYKNATAPLVLRGREQVSSFFDGFDLLEPWLVQAPLWRPEGKRPCPPGPGENRRLRGVGRKADESTTGSVNP